MFSAFDSFERVFNCFSDDTFLFCKQFPQHVNPFQVLSSSSHFFEDNPSLILIANDYTPPFDTEKGTAPANIWRDTAMIPPYGYLVIKQCYDAGVAPSLGEEVETFGGKFVFHW